MGFQVHGASMRRYPQAVTVHSQVVRGKGWEHSSVRVDAGWLAKAGLAALLAASVVTLLLGIPVGRATVRVEALESVHTKLRGENQRLGMAIGGLSASKPLHTAAAERLGLRLPEKGQILRLR